MKTLIQDSSTRVTNIRDTAEKVLIVPPEYEPVGIIMVKSLPSYGWICSPPNTAGLDPEDYVVSGYMTNALRGYFENIELGGRGQVAVFDSLASFGRPFTNQWVNLSRQDWVPPLWEMSISTAFKQQFVDALAKLRSMQGLKQGWDSYDATPISQIAVAQSWALLRDVFTYFASVGDRIPQPFVAPIPDGRIQVEWESAIGDIEVTVDEDGRIEYLLCEGDDLSTCNEGTVATPRELAELLRSRLFRKGAQS